MVILIPNLFHLYLRFWLLSVFPYLRKYNTVCWELELFPSSGDRVGRYILS